MRSMVGLVEEIGVVLKVASSRVGSLPLFSSDEGERGRNWEMRASAPTGSRSARQGQCRCRGLEQVEHDLEKGCMAEVAFGLDGLDDLLEGHVLVAVGVKVSLLTWSSTSWKVRASSSMWVLRCGAQGEGVDEETDQRLDLDASCGWRSATPTTMSSWPL